MSDPVRYGIGLQRTMNLLRTSTPEHRNTVKILFYGQSITKQNWWLEIADDFRQRFPNADIIFDNRAIGGFSSSLLVRTAEHDLYPFYPDLVIFHAYGGHGDYEKIIANIRRRTTAEVVLVSDHVDWLATGTNADDSDAVKRYKWHNKHSNEWLPALAQKYGCELIEIRKPWERYLRDNKLQAQSLLRDGIHLNARGDSLMADLVGNHLRNVPQLTFNPSKETVKRYVVGSDIQIKDGKLALEFDGNRVDLVRNTKADKNPGFAQILIDGKSPSTLPDLYTIGRPSNAIGVEWPSILHVTAKQPLVAEDRLLVVTAVDTETQKVKFDAFGSKTGFDGRGDSDQTFVSDSGRVVIEPQDWWLKHAYQLSNQMVPVGFQIKWRVEPLFSDTYAVPDAIDPSHESVTLAAQNLSNAKHTLELLPITSNDSLPQEIRVYRPLVQ
ncbi:MAG: hypothetical protein KME42_20010 [Tildeniella nuda ZEHNDER 1965/U140]|nr:hypothetical protein [Tildeniella nuda ZEHNDER 1965/U140]